MDERAGQAAAAGPTAPEGTRLTRSGPSQSQWPDLRLSDWEETRDALLLWTQVVGKVRLALEPMVNHWWQV
ncbi:MAG: hypothetical protein JWM85_296, partial [Acidimicrobiaceae bacterium]|nr:hypothetical protein [Acidimicrobiaceae bacterium]